MRTLNGGYAMLYLDDINLYEKVSNLDIDKPLLIYDVNGLPFYARFFKKDSNKVAIGTSNGVVVIKSDNTIIRSTNVVDITNVPTELLEALEAGDIVIKKTTNQYHSYRVSYKEVGQGIILTYADATTVESISYDWSTNKFVYNSTDHTTLTPDA